MVSTSYIRYDDNDDRFVLDQHVQLDLYSASSLKQQSAVRHFPLLNTACLAEKKQILIL